MKTYTIDEFHQFYKGYYSEVAGYKKQISDFRKAYPETGTPNFCYCVHGYLGESVGESRAWKDCPDCAGKGKFPKEA